jgi:hypothetical protein
VRKTDKKTDNQLRLVLTEVCETALKEINGFQWLTHLVNYDDFPRSLKVVCIFDSNDKLSSFLAHKNRNELEALIQKKLMAIGITLKKIHPHVSYDTEESCDREHGGKWDDRLK